MSLEDFLANLALQAGLPKDQFSGQETVNLIFDDKIGVQISYIDDSNEIVFVSTLFQVEDENNLAAIALMSAQANFEQDDLYGAHLAISEQGQVVLLRRVIAQALSNVDFNKLLEEFVTAAEKWSASIASMTESLQEYSKLETEGGHGGMESRMKV